MGLPRLRPAPMRFSSLLVSALALSLSATGCGRHEWAGTRIDPPMPAPDYTLQTAGGQTVQPEQFRGTLTAMAFGFATCPDVCPTTMQTLAEAVDLLPEDARDEVQVVLVSVDPERDGPDAIAAYARAFDPGFVGLSGTPEQVAHVADQLGIFYEKVGEDDGTASAAGYLVDHTASVYVLGRDGRPALLWSFGTTAGEMAADLEALLRL